MTETLPLVFGALMGLSMLLYVLLDGYDLGVGILMPFAAPREQDLMIASIGPFWDANETWLVLGIGILLVAFPVAHGIVLGALYLPVVMMLVGIMLRGAAFEFRVQALGWHRHLWNWLFWLGSLVAAFAQGAMLGRYVTGFGNGFGFVLFAFVTGISLCGGYVLLGATWLVLRTHGDVRARALRWAEWGVLWAEFALLAVSLATPLVSDTVRERWFDFPRTLPLMALPLAALALGWGAVAALRRLAAGAWHADWLPFACAVGIFVVAFAGLAYSLFPYVVMDRLTLWEAAAHPSALAFLLVGTAVVVPLILVYTVFVYRVFWGKVDEDLHQGI
ncbi:MAG: cytochrome d ubiquinol oxidase subunit II [Ignavibacteria bacterium]